jgi:4-azaleucine resistance transporter AzlC
LRSSSAKYTMIRRGFADALPIIIGYIPMGAAYAILARQTGMGFFPTVLMSLIVFAGASQFIAVGLLSGGATALEVVATTLFVNLRHILMSASLSPHYREAPRGLIPFVAWGVTDETFAISIGRYISGEADHRYGLALHYTAYASWVSGTVLGALAGALIPPALTPCSSAWWSSSSLIGSSLRWQRPPPLCAGLFPHLWGERGTSSPPRSWGRLLV